MHKKVLTLTLVLSLLGMLSELPALVSIPQDYQNTVATFLSYLKFVDLTLFGFTMAEEFYSESGLTLNYLNVSFYSTLLIGAILYARSKKETRFIRFGLAVILFKTCLWAVSAIFSPILFWAEYPKTISFTLLVLLGLIKNGGVAYLCFMAMKFLGENKVLAPMTEQAAKDTPTPGQFLPTNMLFRAVHYVIDTIMSLLLFASLIRLMPFLQSIETHWGERTALFTFFLIARTAYYIFFESLFSATPAKLLSESRVLTDNEQKPDTNTILIRTISRYIPFEPFSFAGKRGWHDSLSKTKVVDEVSEGVHGAKYLLIFPFAGLVILGFILGEFFYEQHQRYLEHKAEHEREIAVLRYKLNNLSTSDVIEIRDVKFLNYSSTRTFLKIEIIDGDEISASVIEYQGDPQSLKSLERWYSLNKTAGRLTLVTFKRADLEKTYTPDYDQSDSDKKNSTPILRDEKSYVTLSINRFFGPAIQDRGTGWLREDFTMDLKNTGWPGNVTKLETLEGTMEWVDSLPMSIPTSPGYEYFTLHGAHYKYPDPYKFRMTVVDSLGREHLFIVEGSGYEKTVLREN